MGKKIVGEARLGLSNKLNKDGSREMCILMQAMSNSSESLADLDTLHDSIVCTARSKYEPSSISAGYYTSTESKLHLPVDVFSNIISDVDTDSSSKRPTSYSTCKFSLSTVDMEKVFIVTVRNKNSKDSVELIEALSLLLSKNTHNADKAVVIQESDKHAVYRISSTLTDEEVIGINGITDV